MYIHADFIFAVTFIFVSPFNHGCHTDFVRPIWLVSLCLLLHEMLSEIGVEIF